MYLLFMCTCEVRGGWSCVCAISSGRKLCRQDMVKTTHTESNTVEPLYRLGVNVLSLIVRCP